MKNICLILEYIGTNYCGYQKQLNGISIQQKLEEAITQTTGKAPTTYASGRTDAGVHALGQVVNFETDTTISPDKLALCINRYLPEDIRVVKSYEVEKDFNSRFSAKRKTYEYKVVVNRPLSVFEKGLALECGYDLNLALMHKACSKVVGEHDFSSFMASKSNIKEDTVRTVYAFDFRQEGDLVTFSITGSGFLYNMVRILVGTMIDIARGKIDMALLDELLQGGARAKAGKTIPPDGLYLKNVEY